MVSGHATNVTTIGHLVGAERPRRPRRAGPQQHPGRRQAVRRAGAALPAQRLATLERCLRADPRPLRARADRGRGRVQHGRRLPRPAAAHRAQAALRRLADGRRGACARRDRRARGHGIGEHFGVDRARRRHLDGHAVQDAGQLRRLHRRLGARWSSTSSSPPPGFVYSVGMLAGHRGRGPGRAAHPAARARARRRAAGARALFLERARERGIDTGHVARLGGGPCIVRQLARLPAPGRRPCSSAASTSSRSCIRRCRRTWRGCASSSPRRTPRPICCATADAVREELAAINPRHLIATDAPASRRRADTLGGHPP